MIDQFKIFIDSILVVKNPTWGARWTVHTSPCVRAACNTRNQWKRHGIWRFARRPDRFGKLFFWSRLSQSEGRGWYGRLGTARPGHKHATKLVNMMSWRRQYNQSYTCFLIRRQISNSSIEMIWERFSNLRPGFMFELIGRLLQVNKIKRDGPGAGGRLEGWLSTIFDANEQSLSSWWLGEWAHGE